MFIGFSVAAVLYLQYVLLVMLFHTLNVLYFYIGTSQIMCAVPSMAVFCCLLISYLPGVLLRHFLDDFEIVLVAPIITSITLLLHSTYAVLLL
jgi:hypothetical protein